MEPTKEDLSSLEFNAIWRAIKGWSIQREEGAGYAGATGTDVMTIINAVRSMWTCPGCHTVKFQDDMKINCCPEHNEWICRKCYVKRHPPEGVIFPEWDETTSIETAIGEALGAASVCWEKPEGAGVFDSTRARQILDELRDFIEGRTNAMGHQIR